MAIFVKHNVVRLQVTEDNVSLMQVFQGQEHFSKIDPGSILSKTFVFLEGAAHVATGCVVKKQEKFLRSLESIFQANYEWVVRICKNVSLCLRILYQVLAKNLLLIEYLHRKILACLDSFLIFSFKSEFFDEINHSEGPLTEFHKCFKVLRPNKLFTFFVFSLQLLIKLPNFNEFVLPTGLTALVLSRFIDFDLFSVYGSLFLFFLLKTFNQLILVCVLVLNVLFNLAEFVHQIRDL